MTTIPTQHKAAFLLHKGQHDTEIRNRATPKPKDDEVLIKVTATAINPVDWKVRDWGIFVEEWPAILGSDAAGEVVQAGSKVNNVKVGDRVTFQGIIGNFDSSTFQQYAVIPAELVGILPPSISDEEGGGICLATVAALASFYHKDGVDYQPHPWQQGGDKTGNGKSIVILGGSSSVGQYAIQLARLSGFSNIVTASSSKHHDFLKQLGAHVVLDRNTAKASDYAEAAKAYPLGVVSSTISEADSGVLGIQILQAANPNGVPSGAGVEESTLVHLYTPEPEMEEAAKAAGEKANIRLTNVWGIGSQPHIRPVVVEFMKALGGEDGYLAKKLFIPNKPLVIKGGLSALHEALEKNKTGVSGVKVVFKPHE